jgi:hypothetical protein
MTDENKYEKAYRVLGITADDLKDKSAKEITDFLKKTRI